MNKGKLSNWNVMQNIVIGLWSFSRLGRRNARAKGNFRATFLETTFDDRQRIVPGNPNFAIQKALPKYLLGPVATLNVWPMKLGIAMNVLSYFAEKLIFFEIL